MWVEGVAVGFWFNVGLQSSAEVHINEDGTVTVIEGNPDIGGSRASMALMAAETLGCPTKVFAWWSPIRRRRVSPTSPGAPE